MPNVGCFFQPDLVLHEFAIHILIRYTINPIPFFCIPLSLQKSMFAYVKSIDAAPEHLVESRDEADMGESSDEDEGGGEEKQAMAEEEEEVKEIMIEEGGE